jgi:hypothetical protein
MADNFNMKQFLMENKLGSYSRSIVKEKIQIEESVEVNAITKKKFDNLLSMAEKAVANKDKETLQKIYDTALKTGSKGWSYFIDSLIDKGLAHQDGAYLKWNTDNVKEGMEDIVNNLTNSGRKIKDITAESGLKIMDGVINLGFKDQWMSDDVIKDAVIELLQHKTEVLRKYIGKDQLGYKMVRYNILLDDGVDQVDMEYVKKDDVSSTNEGVAAYEYEEGKEAGEKEAKMKENLSSDAYIRMDGLANIQDLADLKRKLRIVASDWMNEGFDKEDIKEYINDLIDEI